MLYFYQTDMWDYILELKQLWPVIPIHKYVPGLNSRSILLGKRLGLDLLTSRTKIQSGVSIGFPNRGTRKLAATMLPKLLKIKLINILPKISFLPGLLPISLQYSNEITVSQNPLITNPPKTAQNTTNHANTLCT